MREISWRRIEVAEAPTEDALLAALDRGRADGNQGTKGAVMSDPATIDLDPGKTARKKRRRFAAITWLASSLMLVLALVATSPYWAPPLLPILPWNAGGS